MNNVKMFFIVIFMVVLSGGNLYAESADFNSRYIEPEIYSENFKLSNDEFIKHSRSLRKLDAGSITAQSSPSGIEYYEVYAVSSSYSSPDWEFINPGQAETVFDHGGSEIIVAVLQYGYGNTTSATLNAASGSNWATDYICGAINSMHFCSQGETIRGYLRYYRFTNTQGGFFSSSAYSNLVPYGSWTTSINIR